MPAVRGLATHADVAVRRAAYDAEMEAWPRVATTCAAAMNAIKGDANTVNRRRAWGSPLEASLYANAVSRPTYDAMQSAISDGLPHFREWMRCKAQLHGHVGPLPWWDLMAPLPVAPGSISWDEGIGLVRDAFSSYSPALAGLVDRAVDERWIDVAPRDGKQGGAFCMSFVDDRSLVLLNWSGIGRFGADDGARTGPRLPQRAAGTAHAVAASTADGARRDRQHLLRDARRRGRAHPPHRRRSARAARRRPAGIDAGGRRHQVARAVRDRGVRRAGSGARSVCPSSTR